MRTAAIFLIVPLAMMACETQDEVAAARSDLCEDLAQLEAAAAYVRNPPPDATVGEIRSALEDVRDELGDVREEREELSEAQREQIEERFDQLVEDIRTVPQDATPAQVAAQARTRAQAFEQAVTQARSDAQCPAT